MSSTPTPCSAVTEPLESGRVVERIKRESFNRQPGLRHRRRTTHQHEGQESIAWQVSPNHRLTTHDQPQAPLGQPIKGSIKGSESLTHFEAKDSDPLMEAKDSDPLMDRRRQNRRDGEYAWGSGRRTGGAGGDPPADHRAGHEGRNRLGEHTPTTSSRRCFRRE